MARISLSLTEYEYELVKKETRVLRVSIAEVIRRAIRHTVPSHEGGSWMRFAGSVATGNRNSSQSVDRIVYCSKK